MGLMSLSGQNSDAALFVHCGYAYNRARELTKALRKAKYKTKKGRRTRNKNVADLTNALNANIKMFHDNGQRMFPWMRCDENLKCDRDLQAASGSAFEL